MQPPYVPYPPNEDGIATTRPSPIKKKLRARGAIDPTPADQQEGSDADDDPTTQIPSNLDNRFLAVDESHEDEGDISDPEPPSNQSNAPTNQAPSANQHSSHTQQNSTAASPKPQDNKPNGSAEAHPK